MSKISWAKFTLISFILTAIFFILMISSCGVRSLPLQNVVQIKCEVDISQYYSGTIPYRGWQGSGIFIRDDLILTAGHNVDGIVDANVITIDGTIYKAASWYLEKDADIGFIKVKTPKRERMLYFDKAKLGEDVWTYGNPLGIFPILTKGIVSGVDVEDVFIETKPMVVVDAAVNPGNSGCPLFDNNGNILGICSYGYRGAQGMNYFVDSNTIKLALNKYLAIEALRGTK